MNGARRTALASRPARAGVALTAAAGIALLAGCAPASPETEQPATTDPDSSESTDQGSSGGGSGAYADGTYTAEGSYATPESVETITVTVTLEDDIVTAVEVTGDPQKRESEQYQGQFIGGIADAVVGQEIDELNVSRVAGSSLTSDGFNKAVEAIKSEAAN